MHQYRHRGYIIIAAICCGLASVMFAKSYGIQTQNTAILSQNTTDNIPTISSSLSPTPPLIQITPISVNIPVVMYHYVEFVPTSDPAKQKLSINPIEFERQVKELTDTGYTTYFVKEIPRLVKGEIPISSHSAILTFDDGYEDFYSVVWPILKKYNIKGTVYVINNFLGKVGFLSKEQLIELANSDVVEIGAHTMDHINLKGVNDPIAKYQVTESKQDLESIIGAPIETFAYPFGGYRDELASLMKEASLSAVVTTTKGTFINSNNLFTIPRVRAGLLTRGSVSTALTQLINEK